MNIKNKSVASKKDAVKQYKEKLCSPDEAVRCIRSNDWVTYAFFNGKPVTCDRALAARKQELSNILIVGAVTVPPLPEVFSNDPEGKSFHYNDYHFSLLTRLMKIQQPDNVFYAPIMFGEADMACDLINEKGPLNDPLKMGIKKNDVHIMRVSPMDENGFFNFGIHNACMYGWCNANKVILEINENIPVALGGARECIHISEVDHIVESDNEPLFELPEITATDVDRKIADNVFKFLKDGCCIQLGIGAMPNLLGHMISESDLKNLSGHTEMLVDAYMEMYLSGKMNNSMKHIDRFKTAYTFALGSKKLYDWIDNNKALASYNVGYTNGIFNLASIDNLISINSAIEVDLYGQVNAESDGFNQISGNGGMLDFVHGSYLSRGGRSFICLPSTHQSKDGTMVSRIVPHFSPGTITTVPRQMTNFIVTEYGAVSLKMDSLWMRTEKLINIAHPDFRDDLIKAAEKQNIWKKSNKK